MLKTKKCRKCGKTWTRADYARIAKASENRIRNGGLLLIFVAVPATLFLFGSWGLGVWWGVLSVFLVILAYVCVVRAFNRPLHMLPKVRLSDKAAKHKRSWAGLRAQMGWLPLALFVIVAVSITIGLETGASLLETLAFIVVAVLAYVVFAVAVLFLKSFPRREPCLGCRNVFGMGGFGWAGTALPPPGSDISLKGDAWTSEASAAWTKSPGWFTSYLRGGAPRAMPRTGWTVPFGKLLDPRVRFKTGLILFLVAAGLALVLLVVNPPTGDINRLAAQTGMDCARTKGPPPGSEGNIFDHAWSCDLDGDEYGVVLLGSYDEYTHIASLALEEELDMTEKELAEACGGEEFRRRHDNATGHLLAVGVYLFIADSPERAQTLRQAFQEQDVKVKTPPSLCEQLLS